MSIRSLVVACLALGSGGCVQNFRQPIPREEAENFRAEAIEFMKEAVQSDDPVLRMQALEAFQDVAPQAGIGAIAANIDNGYAGASFAALMAVGTVKEARLLDRIRTRSEDTDPNVRIAALFAMHRMGERQRTGELGDFLLHDRDPRVRANAALAIGRLEDASAVKLLQRALHSEKKDAVKLQILEALAMLADKTATERLIFSGYSAVPDQCALALMFLANARAQEAEELFRFRLHRADQPEIKLQAARGLGRLGDEEGLDLACAHLQFRSPERGRRNDPEEQQVARIRALAALALEAIGSGDSLGPLQTAFQEEGQSPYVRLAIARAAISIIDGRPIPARAPRRITSAGGHSVAP